MAIKTAGVGTVRGVRRAGGVLCRPGLRLPQAHPRRSMFTARSGRPVSCLVLSPRQGRRWLWIKVTAVGLLAVVGAVVSASQFVAMYTSGAEVEPVWVGAVRP